MGEDLSLKPALPLLLRTPSSPTNNAINNITLLSKETMLNALNAIDTTQDYYRQGSVLNLSAEEKAIIEIGEWLRTEHYRFITVSPKTHDYLNLQAENFIAQNLRDVFGWSRPFEKNLLPQKILELLQEAKALEQLPSKRNCFKSKIRFSSLNDLLICHSAFPTTDSNSVFFGPDTYRFANSVKNFIKNTSESSIQQILEIACGSGAVGIFANSLLLNDTQLTLSDINPKAISYSRVNAQLAGLEDVEIVESDLFQNTPQTFDLILTNPPYLLDEEARTYRHGGGNLGSELSLKILKESLSHLVPGGRLLLYTGSAIIDGKDIFFQQAQDFLKSKNLPFNYEEIDPDVFGEEIQYFYHKGVERIAVVILTLTLPL